MRLLPPAKLLHLHRHSLMNLLVVGGSPEQRRDVALAFHRESPLRAGPFVAIDCSHAEAQLALALRTARRVGDPVPDPLRAASNGTLFLDAIESLSAATQRLLLAFVRDLGSASLESEPSLRLASGTADGLDLAVRKGSFSAPLYDCLDKIRVELSTFARGAA